MDEHTTKFAGLEDEDNTTTGRKQYVGEKNYNNAGDKKLFQKVAQKAGECLRHFFFIEDEAAQKEAIHSSDFSDDDRADESFEKTHEFTSNPRFSRETFTPEADPIKETPKQQPRAAASRARDSAGGNSYQSGSTQQQSYGGIKYQNGGANMANHDIDYYFLKGVGDVDLNNCIDTIKTAITSNHTIFVNCRDVSAEFRKRSEEFLKIIHELNEKIKLTDKQIEQTQLKIEKRKCELEFECFKERFVDAVKNIKNFVKGFIAAQPYNIEQFDTHDSILIIYPMNVNFNNHSGISKQQREDEINRLFS